MKNEMDIMRMDERQRLHWLKANRATLTVVGLVWLLMIAFEFSQGRRPDFLMIMIPVFAGLRLGFYYLFSLDRDVRWTVPALFVLLLGLGHFWALVAAMVAEFTTGPLPVAPFMFSPASPSHAMWKGAVRVLGFPGMAIVDVNDPFSTPVAWAVMVLNSLLWAGAVFLIFRAVRRRRG